MSKKSLTVFFSYSHADEDLRDKLAEHLSSLKRNKVIDAWHDRQIPAGTQWAKAIDDNLNKADIILLLISSKFLASEYCSDIEVKQAMERHKSNEARVIPIILRACDWSDEEFGALQALPKNAHPVTSWANQDEAFFDIVKGIKRAILDLKDSTTVPVALPNPTVRNFVHFADFNSKSPSAPTVSVPVPEVKKNPVELLSAKGIDYRELEKLLKDKQWYEADQLTDKLMLKASGREIQRYIDPKSIKEFPCEDLQTIDRLWVHYSNGLYGFSVQKDIYVECGGKLDFSYPIDETWEKFCDRTAWKGERTGWNKEGINGWIPYPDKFFKNHLMNVKGHLPFSMTLMSYPRWWICRGVWNFFSRIQTCEV